MTQARTLFTFIAAALMSLIYVTAEGQATLISDKDDYAPGTTVMLTGTGFIPLEIVTMQVVHVGDNPDGTDPQYHTNWTVTADEVGNFEAIWNVPTDGDAMGASLKATADGVSGLHAEAFFTDAAQQVIPRAGSISGGTSVSISAAISSFNLPNSYTVSFGGTAVSANRASATLLNTITSPAHAAGSVDVVINGPDASSSSTITNGFTFVCRNPANILFDETMGMGTAVALTGILSYAGFDNAFNYSGTGAISTASTSSSTTDYSWASGNSNVLLSAAVITRTFQIGGINTTGYTNIDLSFGISKSTNLSNGSELLLEYSTDGTTYTPISFASLPNTTLGTTGWYYRIVSLPVTAATSNLRIRFRNTSTSGPNFRIDDIRLSASPVINTQPSNTTKCIGETATFSVAATSSATLNYQWYKGSVAIGNEVGTNSNSYTTPAVGAVDNGTNYYVVVSGGCSPSVTSSPGKLTVKDPTVITNYYINGTEVTTNKTIAIVYGCRQPILNIAATGPGIALTYQWFSNTTNSNVGGTKITNEQLSSFTIPKAFSVGNHYYYVEVTSSCTTVKSDVFTVTITPQVAYANGKLYYTGPTNAWTPTATSNTATVTLSAFIRNTIDPNDACGDVATARITFEQLTSTNPIVWTPIPSAQNLPVGYIDATDPSKGGTAAAIAQLSISNNAITQIFIIRVVVSGNYIADPDFGAGQITVSKLVPGGSISGGVFLCAPTASGLVRPSTSNLTPSILGFGVEYTIKGGKVQSPKGKVNLFVPSFYDVAGNNTAPYINWYQINSNAIASLAITSPTATFTSKANVALVAFPGGPIIQSMEGNCTMVLEVKDRNSNTCLTNLTPDQVGLTVYKNAGGIWYSNNFNTFNGKTELSNVCVTCLINQVISDLTVSGATTSTTSLKTINNPVINLSGTEILPIKEKLLSFNVKAYPNPTMQQFELYFVGGSYEKVYVNVFDVTGRRMKYIETSKSTTHFGEDLKAGVYLVEVRQGKNLVKLKLIKL